MGMEENWASFIEMTKAKADSHGKVAQYWDSVHNILSLILIFLAASTTLTTLLPVHRYIPASLGALTTLFSAVTGFMAPSNRRQAQMESSRAFRALMLKMVRCEAEREYEELWKEYNKEMLGEPFLPKKYKQKANTNFTMSPEFLLVVKKKEADLAAALEGLEQDIKKPDLEAAGWEKEKEDACHEEEGNPGSSEGDLETNENVKLLDQV